MKKVYMAICIGVLLAVIDIISFSITKYLYIHKSITTKWLVIPFIFYGLQILIFYYGLAYSTMVELNVIWNILSSFLVTLIGIYLFNEKLNSMKIIAILLGTLSVVLFSLSDDHK